MEDHNHPLRAYRKANNLTLEALGAQLGVDKGGLSRIERGVVWPSRDFFERLAVITGGKITPNDFIRFSPDVGATSNSQIEPVA